MSIIEKYIKRSDDARANSLLSCAAAEATDNVDDNAAMSAAATAAGRGLCPRHRQRAHERAIVSQGGGGGGARTGAPGKAKICLLASVAVAARANVVDAAAVFANALLLRERQARLLYR